VTADIEGNDGEFLFGRKHGFGIFNRSTAQNRHIKKAWSEEEITDGKDKTVVPMTVQWIQICLYTEYLKA